MKYKYEVECERNDSHAKYIVLKGLDEPCRQLVIPDSIEVLESDVNGEASAEEVQSNDGKASVSLPVKIIGNHAFSSRKDLEEVIIPSSVHTILGFAFHNCGRLRRIQLTDSVNEYLDGSTRQCESLEEIDVTLEHENYYVVRRILEDNDRRLRFRLHLSDGEAVLVFPGFNYDFVENTMARTIQFAIEGTGYAYRECVKSDNINFREYDSFFTKVSADDSVIAEMIAVSRLQYPYELAEDAKTQYRDWLFKNAKKNLIRAVRSLGNKGKGVTDTNSELSGVVTDLVSYYINEKLIPDGDTSAIIAEAAEFDRTELVSMLMEYQSGNEKQDNFLELDI
ncbi:leucine-rich repeat protein [Butyrivibrio sp. WCD3002]|uniref:leucine-rich repeat protein n=1 Tax=Butyrivibrio sp. WCD3002 TaxID=1280676 RepID=UPI0003F6B7B1|nr:leucine-rich repeat protein [Butyrivibrio sp. WCD3002]